MPHITPAKQNIVRHIQRSLAAGAPEPSAVASLKVIPEAYSLPAKGRDPFFNCTRSWYYAAEKQGLIRLIRIRGMGKLRGIVRVNYEEMKRLFGEAAAK